MSNADALRARLQAINAQKKLEREAKEAGKTVAQVSLEQHVAASQQRQIPAPPQDAIGTVGLTANLLQKAEAASRSAKAEALLAPERNLPSKPELYEAAPELVANIQQLHEMLLDGVPALPTLLQLIHKNTASNPELVHLLTREQIRTLYAAAFARTQTVLAPQPKTAAAKAKKSGPLSAADLF